MEAMDLSEEHQKAFKLFLDFLVSQIKTVETPAAPEAVNSNANEAQARNDPCFTSNSANNITGQNSSTIPDQGVGTSLSELPGTGEIEVTEQDFLDLARYNVSAKVFSTRLLISLLASAINDFDDEVRFWGQSAAAIWD